MSETISMSPHELSRVEVMQQLKAKRITQARAAEQLGLTVRHATRSGCGGPTVLAEPRRWCPGAAAGRPTTNSTRM